MVWVPLMAKLVPNSAPRLAERLLTLARALITLVKL